MNKTIPAAVAAAVLLLTGCTTGTPASLPSPSATPTTAATPTETPTLSTPSAPTYTEAEAAYLKTQGYDVDTDTEEDLAEGLDDGRYECESLAEEVDEYGEADAIQALVEDGSSSVKGSELPAAKYLCPELLPLVTKALDRIKKVGGVILTATANGSGLVTYTTEDGGQQHRFSGKWTKRLKGSPDIVVLSVTASGASKVTCKITNDGYTEASEKATGRYSSASCTMNDN